MKEAAAKVVKKAVWPIHANLWGGPGQGWGRRDSPLCTPRQLGGERTVSQDAGPGVCPPLPSAGSAGFLGRTQG